MRDLWSGTYRRSDVWAETARRLVDLAELASGATVLDVGTGYGGTLFPAIRCIGETGHIIGIDVEEDCVGWTREEVAKRGISKAEVLLMDGRSMGFSEAGFDAAIAGMVGLDDDYDRLLNRPIDAPPLTGEIFRVLRPGGSFAISGWLWQEDTEWMGQLVRRQLPNCSRRGYFPITEEGYIDLLQCVGFESIRATSFEGRYTFEDAAEWMAVIGPLWNREIEEIRSRPPSLSTFEREALDFLANHVNEEGKISYTRSAPLVTARKP